MPTRRAVLRSLALGALAASFPSARATGRPIRIGQVADLTGIAATFGLSLERGSQLAVTVANAEGGVAGHPVALDVQDGMSRPEDCVRVARAMLARAPMAILGPSISTRTVAVAAVTEPAGVPLVATSATRLTVLAAGDFTFLTTFDDTFQGTAMARWLAASDVAPRVAVLGDGGVYCTTLVDAFRVALSAGAIVGEERYAEGDVDFVGVLRALLVRAPDVLYLPGFYTEVGFIARQARELGFRGRFVGGDGWASDMLNKIGQRAIEGGVYVDHWAIDDPDPVSRRFVDAFRTVYHRPPDSLAALAYDAVGIVVAALRRVAATSGVHALVRATPHARAALRDELLSTHEYPSLAGSVTINPDRTVTRAAVLCEVTAADPRFIARVTA